MHEAPLLNGGHCYQYLFQNLSSGITARQENLTMLHNQGSCEQPKMRGAKKASIMVNAPCIGRWQAMKRCQN